LLHEVEKAAIFCDGPELTIKNFRALPGAFGEKPAAPETVEAARRPTGRIQDVVDEVERTMIRDAMIKHGGNKKKVAEELGISRAYLYKKLPSE
jgi:DNA-binding NtrC family response regulator